MILVTGASGLLGANLVALAKEQGRAVVGQYHSHPVGDAASIMADLTNGSAVQRIFDEVKPASVIHCAAATDVDWCQDHPEATHQINVAASAIIAEHASRIGARMLYISTDSVFDGARGHYAESDLPTPINVYAQTKLQGEQAVLAANPAAAIARINVYGWNAQDKQSLAEWILQQLAAGKVVPGFSDVIFCPILANDLAEILLAMLDAELSGLYHVAGAESISKFEFARRLALAFGLDPELVVSMNIAESNLKAARPRDTSLSTQKICAALGRAMSGVDSGLRRFAELKAGGYVDRLKGQLTEVRH